MTEFPEKNVKFFPLLFLFFQLVFDHPFNLPKKGLLRGYKRQLHLFVAFLRFCSVYARPLVLPGIGLPVSSQMP